MTATGEIAKRWLEAFNAHDEDGLLSVTDPEAVLEAPGGVYAEGRDAVVEYAMNWLSAFPDAEMEVEQEIAADGWITHRFVFEGTQSGTLAGPAGEISPTNRQLRGRGAQLMRVADGGISEIYLYFDQLEVLTQLGLVKQEVGARSR